MRPNPRRRRAVDRGQGGFATWIKMSAADEVIAENGLIWDTLDDLTKGELINRRAAELQRDYDERIARGNHGMTERQAGAVGKLDRPPVGSVREPKGGG